MITGKNSAAAEGVKLVNKENGEFPFRFPENSNFLKKALEECKPPRDGNITKLKSEKKTVPPPQLFNLTA